LLRFDLKLFLWDNPSLLKALMETSMPDESDSEPGMVEAGAEQRAENPSGAANRTPSGQ